MSTIEQIQLCFSRILYAVNNTPEDSQKLAAAASQETDETKLRAILRQVILAATQAQERVHTEIGKRLAKASGTAQATHQT